MSQTTAIELLKDLKQADEQAQLRAALRWWLKAKNLRRAFLDNGPTDCLGYDVVCDEFIVAEQHLETVARRLEGM